MAVEVGAGGARTAGGNRQGRGNQCLDLVAEARAVVGG